MLRHLAKSDKQHPALFLLALLPYFTPPKPPHAPSLLCLDSWGPSLTSVEISWNVTLALSDWMPLGSIAAQTYVQTHHSFSDHCTQSPHDCCHPDSSVGGQNWSSHACVSLSFFFPQKPRVTWPLQPFHIVASPSRTQSSVCHGDLARGRNEKVMGRRGNVKSLGPVFSFNIWFFLKVRVI